MKYGSSIALVAFIGVLIPCGIFAASIVSSGERKVDSLETIHGIPYPKTRGIAHIEEELAHADIFINSPVFAKKLTLEITYDPKEVVGLEAGIRSGEFWLGYDKQKLYTKGVDKKGLQTKALIFPITSAFQDTNQSIDLMLFTNPGDASWDIQDIRAHVSFQMPNMDEAKDYIKSIVHKEREP